MPAKEESITPRSPTEFIETLRDLIDNGQGLAPLIGSGVSAPSGILMGQDFTDFLGYTVSQVIYNQWDIRRNGWPKYPSKEDVDNAKAELFKTFTRVCENHGVVPVSPPDGQPPHMVYALERIQPESDNIKHENLDKFERVQEELRLGLSVPLIPDILCHPHAYKLENKRRELYQQIYRQHPSEDWQPPTLQSPSSYEFVCEKAIRSLYDWRATLSFLASVSTYKYTATESRPMLVSEDTSMIDSFNVHITRNKKPNLSHLMIARLVRPLRSRLILTTNFDSLLEESFAELSEPLQVLEVSSRGRLPSYQTVRAQNCLIKLHGSLSETRADFSLDEPPNEDDKNTFAAYFCGGRRNLRSQSPIPSSDIGLQHLFVMGYSGRDQRTVQLIKYALDSHRDLKLFWICHTDSDAARVEQLFSEPSYREQQKIYLTVTDRPDLLLYELYQKVSRSLPGGGFSFQYSPNVPPEYASSESESESEASKSELPREVIKVKAYIEKFQKHLKDVKYEPPYVVSSASGVNARMSALFDHFKGGRVTPLWLELEDYISPQALLFDIVQIMALKLGYYQLDHANLLPDDGVTPDYTIIGNHIKKLIGYLGLTPANWPLFLYGRNGAGGCAGFTPRYWEKEFEELGRLMTTLTEQGFPVIYFPYNEQRRKHDQDASTGCKRSIERLSNNGELDGVASKERDEFNNLVELSPKHFDVPSDGITSTVIWNRPTRPHPRSYTDIITRIISFAKTPPSDIDPSETWLVLPNNLMDLVPTHLDESKVLSVQEQLRKLHFLYVFTLFRQSRHTSALVSEATYNCPHQFNLLGFDNDRVRYGYVDLWVKQLQSASFLLTKPGGYNWCFRDVRLGLQSLLEGLTNIPALPVDLNLVQQGKIGTYDYLGQTRARTHYWIGHWYQKTFASTGHYIPLIEALSHQLEVVRYAPFAKPATFSLNAPKKMDFARIRTHRRTLLLNGLNEAEKTLRQGRESLKFWLVGMDPDMFDARHIEHISDYLKQPIVSELLGLSRIEDDAAIVEGVERLKEEFESIYRSLRAESGVQQAKVFLPPMVFKGVKNIGKQELEYIDFENDENPKEKFLQFFKENTISHSLMSKLFDIIEAHLTIDTNNTLTTGRKNIRTWRADVSEEFRGNSITAQSQLYSIIWALSELSYIYLQIAKKLRFNDVISDPTLERGEFVYIQSRPLSGRPNQTEPLSESEKTVLKYWALVSALCWTCIELCRSLHPQFADQEASIKIKCNSLYAVSLSHLNRFSEAHRRLNEAHALMPRGRLGFRGHDFACLHLRRAEVYLNQAEHEFHCSERTWAKFLAHIDDAWVSLERAEKALSGTLHSSLWWGQLYSLKLRTFSLFGNMSEWDLPDYLPPTELAVRPMPFRRRLQYDDFIKEIVERVLLTYSVKSYRTCRVCWYYVKIARAFQVMKIPDLHLAFKPVLDAVEGITGEKKDEYQFLLNTFNIRFRQEAKEITWKFAIDKLGKSGDELTNVEAENWADSKEKLEQEWSRQPEDKSVLTVDEFRTYFDIMRHLNEEKRVWEFAKLRSAHFQRVEFLKTDTGITKLSSEEWESWEAKVCSDWTNLKGNDRLLLSSEREFVGVLRQARNNREGQRTWDFMQLRLGLSEEKLLHTVDGVWDSYVRECSILWNLQDEHTKTLSSNRPFDEVINDHRNSRKAM